MEFLARCAGGFEEVLAKELVALGCKRVKSIKGGALFAGEYADGLRACLWSRAATRILMEIVRTSAHSADTLYAGVRKVPWDKIIAPGATIAMHASGQNSALRNTQFTAVKVKDAVCDKLVDTRGARPDVDGDDPDFPVDVVIFRDRATVYLNLSGPVLHKRGYREPGVQTEAPLKETLAASMLLAAGWDEMLADGVGFADPMCGSGTLPIEAALIATNTAPGLLRNRWGFESYLRHDQALWDQLVAQAEEARIPSWELGVRIIGSDVDAAAVEVARANAERAGVGELVELYVDDAANLATRIKRGRRLQAGLVACNPPYGYRLNSGESLSGVYKALGEATDKLGGDWRLATISPDPGIDAGLGRAPLKAIPCHNGPLSTDLRIYDLGPAPTVIGITSLSGANLSVPVAESASQQFASRLRKVAKERAKWARKTGVQSYRVYDADLPDYAFSVDLYRRADDDAMLARVEEHRAGAGVERKRADRRFFDGLAIIPAVLDMASEQVFFKRSVYEKGMPAPAACWTDVREAEFTFEVDLGSQRECGLALDMRPVRELLRAEAAGKRFACLLAHGGAPTVYAAAGGAASTVTVDPSKVFLEQAQRTVRANGFSGCEHAFVCEDALEWLVAQAEAGSTYDLVFCDLSAFPAVKADREVDFQLQNQLQSRSISQSQSNLRNQLQGHHQNQLRIRPRNQSRGDLLGHLPLIKDIAQILAPEGKLILTCRENKSVLSDETLAELGMSAQDITSETIDHDFSRTPKIHRAFLLQPKA